MCTSTLKKKRFSTQQFIMNNNTLRDIFLKNQLTLGKSRCTPPPPQAANKLLHAYSSKFYVIFHPSSELVKKQLWTAPFKLRVHFEIWAWRITDSAVKVTSARKKAPFSPRHLLQPHWGQENNEKSLLCTPQFFSKAANPRCKENTCSANMNMSFFIIFFLKKSQNPDVFIHVVPHCSSRSFVAARLGSRRAASATLLRRWLLWSGPDLSLK